MAEAKKKLTAGDLAARLGTTGQRLRVWLRAHDYQATKGSPYAFTEAQAKKIADEYEATTKKAPVKKASAKKGKPKLVAAPDPGEVIDLDDEDEDDHTAPEDDPDEAPDDDDDDAELIEDDDDVPDIEDLQDENDDEENTA